MIKNTASQFIAAQMISATDGSDVTGGTTSVAVEIDGVAGTGGTATHIANGKWEYAPIQADTNGDHLTFQFTNASAVTVLLNVYTNTLDTQLATIDSEVGAIQTDLDNATDGLGAIKTDTAAIAALTGSVAGVDTAVDAIKLQTDKLTFTKGTELDVNVQSINDATVVGDGNATAWDGA